MLVNTIGESIKKRRKELGITQPHLAELAKVSVNTLYKLERGQGNPSLDVMSKLAEVMGMDSCSIYLLEPPRQQASDQAEGTTSEGTLVLKASTGLAADAVGHARLRVGEGITGWAAKEGRPLAISDAASDPRFKLLPETRELRFKSLLAVPLISREQTIGAVNVQTRAQHIYGDDALPAAGEELAAQ